jgi:hypothetical protein
MFLNILVAATPFFYAPNHKVEVNHTNLLPLLFEAILLDKPLWSYNQNELTRFYIAMSGKG